MCDRDGVGVLLEPCPDCGDASPSLSVRRNEGAFCGEVGAPVYHARAEVECPTCGRFSMAYGSSAESEAFAEEAAVQAALGAWTQVDGCDDDEEAGW